MKAAQLKALCKDQGLKLSGKKADLIERLRAHFLTQAEPKATQDDFDGMCDGDIRASLGARELDTSGNREEMLHRLRSDIEFTRQITTAATGDAATGYQTISEALAAAAQNGGAISDIMAEINAKSIEEPKFIDVTIRSLGMVPDKYTAGGAPSVTADVLRKLAGDPLDERPKYGTVSQNS
jgi:SAP domain